VIPLISFCQNKLQVWSRLDARKQFLNFDDQTELMDVIMESDWERALEIVEDIRKNNGKVVEPYYYCSSDGLVASVINALIAYIGYIANGQYIRLTLQATKDEKQTTLNVGAGHVIVDVFGSGPRKNGEGGTIDHSMTGRRQHNVADKLVRIPIRHNIEGGYLRSKDSDIQVRVSRGNFNYAILSFG